MIEKLNRKTMEHNQIVRKENELIKSKRDIIFDAGIVLRVW